MAFYPGSSGTYNLVNSQLAAGNLDVALSGAATFSQSGGTLTVSNNNGFLNLGSYAGSSGVFNLGGGGQVSATNGESVGNYGTGVFNQSSGTNSDFGTMYLGLYAGGSGAYNLNGGRLSTSS